MNNGKWNDFNTKENMIRVEGWARQGLTDLQIAEKIGISVSTFYNWRRDHEEFDAIVKRGKEVIDFEVEQALLKKALGYTYDEEVHENDGSGLRLTKVTTKHVPGDTTAQIYWLKNRMPGLWRDTQLTKAQRKKIETETKFIEERINLIKGAKKDMTGLEILMDVLKPNEED